LYVGTLMKPLWKSDYQVLIRLGHRGGRLFWVV
jgi:hypothetical protein